MEENYEGLLFRDDERDFQSSHILGDLGSVKEEVDLGKYVDAHNQGGTMHCTAYGLTHVMEILNSIEHEIGIRLDPEEQWANQLVDPGTAKESYGDYFISALKSLAKFGLTEKHSNVVDGKFTIDSYAAVYPNIITMKKHLSAGLPIYTGCVSMKTTWSTAKTTGYLPPFNGRPSGGHAFALVGYKDDYFICKNSYGSTWGKWGDGTFRIRFADMPDLSGKYIVFDSKDIPMIFRDVSENSPFAPSIKKALDKGIFKGYDSENIADPKDRLFMPDKGVSRAELSALFDRLGLLD